MDYLFTKYNLFIDNILKTNSKIQIIMNIYFEKTLLITKI